MCTIIGHAINELFSIQFEYKLSICTSEVWYPLSTFVFFNLQHFDPTEWKVTCLTSYSSTLSDQILFVGKTGLLER